MADEQRPSDFDIQSHNEEVMQESIKNQPLVGERAAISTLVEEYASATETFQRKTQELAEKFKFVRRIRRDGNCFVRAFWFALLDRLGQDDQKEELKRVIELADGSKAQLLDQGFPEFGVEEFWEVMMEQLKEVEKGTYKDEAKQVIAFNDREISDYLVCMGRVLISGSLQRNAEFYEPFLADESVSIVEFCKREVEPMGTESDTLQITALIDWIRVPIQIAYLDNSPGPINFHVLPEGAASPPLFTLLYRPGHYDILYV
eukprot:TRINITY_DN7932_c0_g1_i1.p1 TRINITY_DN7932_c0_g1~~TRINITY_DN7932_c0_g1_i1.p1  ORF type:complete len:267 (+),score=110.98 TRINITY_DN7932_c0_g1_i1:23-802(+)